MPRPKRPPQAPAGYQLLTEESARNCCQALMAEIGSANTCLYNAIWCGQAGETVQHFIQRRDAMLAALAELDQHLAQCADVRAQRY